MDIVHLLHANYCLKHASPQPSSDRQYQKFMEYFSELFGGPFEKVIHEFSAANIYYDSLEDYVKLRYLYDFDNCLENLDDYFSDEDSDTEHVEMCFQDESDCGDDYEGDPPF